MPKGPHTKIPEKFTSTYEMGCVGHIILHIELPCSVVHKPTDGPTDRDSGAICWFVYNDIVDSIAFTT